MTYKEFNNWCNERACDGFWGVTMITECIEIIHQVQREWFWKREKKWQELSKKHDMESKLAIINSKIDGYLQHNEKFKCSEDVHAVRIYKN